MCLWMYHAYYFECHLSVEVCNGILNWVGVFTAFHNKGLGIFTQFSGQLG